MKEIQRYVGLVSALAFLSVALTDWSQLQQLTAAHWLGFLSLIVLALLSESLALAITVEDTSGSTSITFLPVLTAAILFGPEAAVVCAVVAGGTGEILLRKKEPIRVIFNISQWIVATAAAGWVFTISGGQAVAPSTASAGAALTDQFLPVLLYAVIFLLLNHLAVSCAISLSNELPFLHVWRTLVGQSAGNVFYDLLISPIAIAVAFFYVALGVVGLLVALLPLLFIRHSYLTNLNLQKANRDLLKALVKAIETRDPYTSGHSLRVSSLARRIAEELNLSVRTAEAIETAALLHDIGKIDPVYTDILKKPSSLTPGEREIIESHVAKGVELLRSLSSFDNEVILAVKHHHERVDGKGYPDGLSGKDIPIGGRIIKVCDAIDAMLSDRPYRDALNLPTVREQLKTYSGLQFDREIVETVVAARLLEEHREEVRTSTRGQNGEAVQLTSKVTRIASSTTET